MNLPDPVVTSDDIKSPAPPKRPGHVIGGERSNAAQTLLSPEALAFAATVRQAQRLLVKDKAYRATPVGAEVGRFIRSLRWSDKSQNTLDTYEIVLARLAYDHAHYRSLDEFTTEALRDFLDEHWGDAAPATRRNRLAVVKSFFRFAVEERGLDANPAERIRPPKGASVERQAHSVDVLERLRRAQPSLRDQIAVQLMARMALRREELRLLRVRDFDLGNSTFLVHGKGGKVVVMPLAFNDLKTDVEVHLVGRDPAEYLLYPRNDPSRPMNAASVHRWFKRCLERAGLPASMKPHELRHSAADNLWRQTGNLVLAQQLLRHASVQTTQLYLHPSRDDLAAGLASLSEVLRSDDTELME